MTLLTVRTIVFKELLDTFRDKRTLVAMIGVPILLYPALFIGATQAALVQQSRMEKQSARVALRGPSAGMMESWLKSAKGFEVLPDPGDAALDTGAIDAIVESPGDLDSTLRANGRADLSILYDAAEPRSREARGRLQDALRETRARIVADRVKAAGLADTFAEPLKISEKNVAPPAKSTGSILGTVLPLIMVVMLGVGAFYPAVDLTAGEKERGTFETLLSTPATKLDIVAGKFLAVFLLSMLTGALNLGSMLATFAFQLAQVINAQAGGELQRVVIEISPQSAFIILVVLVPLAFFISALMMTVALLARSFREAQNYVSPFFIALVLPAGVVAVPSVQLDRVTQFIPITNVALLFRDLLIGKPSGEAAFVVFLSTAVCAMLALLVAVWMFQREDVVLSQESVAPFTLDRRSLSPSEVPTPGIALAIFGLVMLLIFYAGSALQTWRLHAGLALTQYGLILLPVLFALWFGKVRWRSALNLRIPSTPSLAGAIIVGVGWVFISIQLGVYLQRAMGAPKELETIAQKLFDVAALPGGVYTLLAIVALSPAICEEALFRGVLLSALKPKLPTWAVIALIGLLFGLFHLSIYKVVSTGLTGALFTYLALRTGSILCASVAHLLLNGLAILIETGHVPAQALDRLKELNIEQNGLPLTWLAAAFTALAAGIVLIEWDHRRRERP